MDGAVLQARAQRADSTFRHLGMTQTQVAACLGASQGQISRILRGHNLRPSRLFEEVASGIFSMMLRSRQPVP